MQTLQVAFLQKQQQQQQTQAIMVLLERLAKITGKL